MTESTEPFVAPDVVLERPPLTPERRAYEEIDGNPLRIGDHEWLLPLMMTSPNFDTYRDEMIRQCSYEGKYTAELLRAAGQILLMCNYDLDGDEAFWLIHSAPLDDLRDAVEECLIAYADRRCEYHDWVRSALLANGLVPDLIPEADLPHVLVQLIKTGRAIPPQDFLGVAIAGEQHRRIKSMASPTQSPAEVSAT